MSRTADPAVAAADDKKPKRRGGRSREPNLYARYIYQILREEAPEMAISSSAMQVLESLVVTLATDLVNETAAMANASKRRAVSSRDAKAAVRLRFSQCGELGERALAEGVRASEAYAKSVAQ